MKRLDINIDLGEGSAFDAELLALADRANVCLGLHAGSPELTGGTFDLCERLGRAAGLHPGYPDRSNFGRIALAADEIPFDVILADCLRWRARATYLKPHGAFYNQSADDPAVAAILERLLREVQLPLLGLPGTLHECSAESAGVGFMSEGFLDRQMTADGRLVPRTEPGAMITDPARALAHARGSERDSWCVHGDSPGALAFLAAIREAEI